jgi:hypothetical protein
MPPGPADVQLALRLKVENKRITEAEHIFARITAPNQIANLQKPRPAFFATVAPAQRSSRDVLLLIGSSYYDAAHIFKIDGGKIHEIEAMGFTLPLYSKNGWSPSST